MNYTGERKNVCKLCYSQAGSQAGPGRKVKQGQEEISRKHVQRLFLGSVHMCRLGDFAHRVTKITHSCRGRIHYSEMYEMLKNMDPPLGFGSKCPDRLAYKKLIRMNMPLDNEGKVHFNTTLFALIRENLNIKMRSAEEMDQADIELRETILKVWPFTAKDKIEVLVPTTRGESGVGFS